MAIRPILTSALLALALAPRSGLGQDQQRSVLTYHGDNSRSGHYVVPALSWEKARSLQLDRAFNARAAGAVYAQPLYWRAPGATTGMLFVATENNVVQAFDAITGKELWKRAVGRPVAASSLPCGNIDPLGITGTPVIDPVTEAIYFDAAVERENGIRHLVFALAAKDGSVLPGWPIDVADALKRSGRQFDPRVQNQRSALTVVDDMLYIAFGGHFGDCGQFHGWIIGLPTHNPHQLISFQTRGRGGGSWSPGGPSVVGHDIFFSTGNTLGASNWSDGEAIFRLGADLHRSDDKRDYFAPSDWKTLDSGDTDLGGSNPIPLEIPGPGGDRALILALGKDGKAYLLDRNNLGGIGGQLAAETVSRSEIITSPATFQLGDDVFVALQAPGAHCPQPGRRRDLTILKIAAGSPPRISTAWCGELRGRGSPIVTTVDGHSNPTVWMLGAEGDNRLHAFRGDTGEPVFVSEPLDGLRHFQTPIVAGDHLYVGADDRLYAFHF